MDAVLRLPVRLPGTRKSTRILLSPESRPTLGHTQPCLQWIPGALFWRIKTQHFKITTRLNPMPCGATPQPSHACAYSCSCGWLRLTDSYKFTVTAKGLEIPWSVHFFLFPPSWRFRENRRRHCTKQTVHTGHVACMWEVRNACNISIWNPCREEISGKTKTVDRKELEGAQFI